MPAVPCQFSHKVQDGIAGPLHISATACSQVVVRLWWIDTRLLLLKVYQ